MDCKESKTAIEETRRSGDVPDLVTVKEIADHLDKCRECSVAYEQGIPILALDEELVDREREDGEEIPDEEEEMDCNKAQGLLTGLEALGPACLDLDEEDSLKLHLDTCRPCQEFVDTHNIELPNWEDPL